MKVKHYTKFRYNFSTGKPKLAVMDKKNTFFLGMNIGQKEIDVLLADYDLNIVKKSKAPRTKRILKHTLAEVLLCIEKMLEEAKVNKKNIKVAGLGFSDPSLDSLARPIQKAIGAETFYGDSACCAAFGERMFNPEAQGDEILYIHSDLGQGVIIKNGMCVGDQAVIGAEHPEEQLPPGMEEIGKIAKYLMPWSQGLGVAQAAKKEVGRGIGTKIVQIARGEIENISKEVVIEAAHENDEVASDIIKSAAINIGIRVAYLINLVSPKVVVIGDGISGAGNLVLDPVMSMTKRLAIKAKLDRARIVLGKLGEDAAPLGAAAMAVKEYSARI